MNFNNKNCTNNIKIRIQTFINFKLYDYGIKFIDIELNAFAR